MAELLLRKPVEEGIPPSPFSGLKMTLTHGHGAKTYELTQTGEIMAHIRTPGRKTETHPPGTHFLSSGTTWSF